MSGRIATIHAPGERHAMIIGVVSGALYVAIYFLQGALSPLYVVSAIRTTAALYVAATFAIFVCYAAVVALAASGALRDRRALLLAFAFPFLFNVALTAGRPHLSTDVLTYVAQGHQVVSGRSPYGEPVSALAETRFGLDLAREGSPPIDDVSPYGPLWTEVEAIAGFITADIATQALLMKVVVTAFSLGSAVLIWLILGLVSPRHQITGTILYLWNPVVVMELAGEGHNDAPMIFFLLASVYLWIRGRIGESFAAILVGALVKIVSVVFVPLELIYLWRTRQVNRGTAGALLLGGCAAAAIGIVAYAPVWAGWHTFDGIRAHATPNLMSGSTPNVSFWYLTRIYPARAAARVLSLLMAGGFLGCVAVVGLRIHDAASFVRSFGRTAIVYLALAPGYWPWYAALPVALLALAPGAMAIWSIFAISLGARLAAPIDALRMNGLLDWDREMFSTTMIGVWFPVSAIGLRYTLRARAAWKNRPAALTVWRVPRPGLEQP
jgi:alpha-1,6-mannosyltransferase